MNGPFAKSRPANDVASVIAGSAFSVANVGAVAVRTLGAFAWKRSAGAARAGCTGEALPVDSGSAATSRWRYERTPACSRPGFCPIRIERSASWLPDRACTAVVPTIDAARAASVASVTRREAAGRMVIGPLRLR